MYGRLLQIREVLWPPRCAGCRTPGAWWCAECQSKVVPIRAPLCPGCHRLSPQGRCCPRCRHRFAFTGVIAGAHAHGPLLVAVKGLKYRHQRVVSAHLAGYAALALANHSRRANFVLVPVPLHPGRLRQRGHNQAAGLAQEIARLTGLPLATRLRRVRPTASQTGLDRSARRHNVHRAFVWNGPPVPCIPLLVDDVLTTGATLDAASQALRQAGHRQVWGLVIGLR